MVKYKIKLYRIAKQDLIDIVDYVNTLSQDAAIGQYDRIIAAIASLGEFPQRCPLLKRADLRAKGYRVLVVDNYLVFYITKDHTVQIRRILFGKRRYEWLL